MIVWLTVIFGNLKTTECIFAVYRVLVLFPQYFRLPLRHRQQLM